MRKLLTMLLLAVAVSTVLSACGAQDSRDTDGTGVANPASVYCEEHGGTVEVREGEDGGQYGVCVFENGSECEEWAYYRRECEPE